ncbi:MAG: DUF2867 domain-containing protein [Burkholderiaceae bacterium]
MNQVKATTLPAFSELHQRIIEGDFIDCYGVPSAMPPRRAAEVITHFPSWARGLLVIRRLITAPFGLSNDGPQASDKLGPFPVESETNQELVAGFNDKHLNFRVSVISHAGQVYLSTWVRPNHWSGRVYLAVIMPFHILIARNALKRVAAAS